MPMPSSTIRATFHNASLTLKVRSSVVAGIPGSGTASTTSLCSKTRHKSFYGQPVFPLSVVVFELSVPAHTVPLHSVLVHLTTALKQVACLLTDGTQPNHPCLRTWLCLDLARSSCALDRDRSKVSQAIFKLDILYTLVAVQPIISARQTPGPALYLESVSLRYGFQRTESAEIPLSELLEECHQRLLGSILIRCVESSNHRVFIVQTTSPSRRRYPLVFGTWKSVSNRGSSSIPSPQ